MLECIRTASLLISMMCGSIVLYGNCEIMHDTGMTAVRAQDPVNQTERMSMVVPIVVFVSL